jgi:hypothetical protein
MSAEGATSASFTPRNSLILRKYERSLNTAAAASPATIEQAK